MKRRILLLASLISLIGCAEKESADLLVENANIYTVDSLQPKATAFVIADGRFIDVGETEALKERYRAEQVIDAGGKTIIPGLIDAHCHFYGLGLNQQRVNLVGTESYEEVLQRVVAFQKEKKAPFILGRGWDQNDWALKKFPHKERLDQLFPETPVILERVDGHAYLVNQKALDMAGITSETVVEGGAIIKENGELTGVLVDNPMGMIDAIIPEFDLETQVKALKEAQEICFDYGLTTVNDAGLNKETIYLIDSLQKAGELDMRVYAMISNIEEDVNHFLERGILKTDGLNVRSVKVYGDGALGSRGAAMKEPYSDHEGHFGAMVTPVDQIEGLAMKLSETKFQMNTHAIGDSANVAVLRAYEKALDGKADRRWKIEHAQIVDLDDMHYFSENILPSVQPTHATSDMYWAEDRVGAERMRGAYAYKKLLEESGMVALGTDFPVEQVSPFYTFYAATARKDLKGYPEGGFQMQDALTREETLKGMTLWAAWSNFEEDEKGSIEPGKFADFIVLDKDIMEVPLEEVPGIQVEETWLGGKKVK
ncbi:amidohydrolase [Robertkochia marina]|uniref:Amidohydrolase n=1 Tax=Robertkochia marina TaxID=1227945 RepID=A0A4S3LZ38_9FLAO|nr:amidohydrolase [Robertkochia marina]THD67341.1 amidohydrolase [Robertkochia marina]TRZ42998.1 amidohydrolase [Robertkochia marina]